MEHPNLIVVRTFGNRIEADLAHSALEAAEIDSTIIDDDAGGTQPELWLRGVKLLVREDDLLRAAEILDASNP
jgi:Putative prokaryotic signal transducing protein